MWRASMMRAAAALGGVCDVDEGGPWCMEIGHREGSMMHMEGVCDARCGSFRGGL